MRIEDQLKHTPLYVRNCREADQFEIYQLIHKHELSKENRNNALESMIKVTENRKNEEANRKIKGRLVADGSK